MCTRFAARVFVCLPPFLRMPWSQRQRHSNRLRYRRTLHRQDQMESFILMLYDRQARREERGLKTMRMRSKVSIVTMVGAGALLLCALAAIIAFRAQVANASINPPHPDSHGSYVEVALVNTTVAPGEYLRFGALFHGLPCLEHNISDKNQCDSLDEFPDIDYEYEVRDSSDEFTDKCELSGYADGIIPRTLSGSYRHWKTYGSVSHRISSDCEPGPYKIRLTLTHSSCSEDNAQCTDSKTFHVSVSPPTATPTNTRQPAPPTATPPPHRRLRVDRHGRRPLPRRQQRQR